MSAVAESLCTCDSFGRTDLRQCPEHFHLWNGDRRLTSVGRIVAVTFPLDPSIPPDRLLNAQERGSEVDKLFARWILGNLHGIPPGTRLDSRALLDKLMRWYDQQDFKTVEVQVLLGCEDHGGVVDFRFDGIAWDLKCTFDVMHTARLQVAGYGCLNGSGGRILHVTERYAMPRVSVIEQQDFEDWELLRDHWRMQQRRTA